MPCNARSIMVYRCNILMYRYYNSEHNNCILLNPPIQFGRQSIYSTRTHPYFAAIHCFKLSFSQKFFCSKGVYWWNTLPHKLLDHSLSFNELKDTYTATCHYIMIDLICFLFIFFFCVLLFVRCSYLIIVLFVVCS